MRSNLPKIAYNDENDIICEKENPRGKNVQKFANWHKNLKQGKVKSKI